MAFRSKEEPRSSFLFSQKSWQMNILQIPQQVQYGEGGPFTRHFAYFSKTLSFKFPSKEALPQGPLHGIPCREMPHHYRLPSFIYQNPRSKNPSKYQVLPGWKEDTMERDACIQRLSYQAKQLRSAPTNAATGS